MTNTATAAPKAPEAGFATEPLSAVILKSLLDKLNISVSTGALNQACQHAQQEYAGATPTQRMNAVLKTLKITQVKVAQLRWSRFDQRKLPAMIFYQQQWQLIERDAERQLLLTGADNETQKLDAEEIEEALILWLQVLPKSNPEGKTSIKESIAARLVLSEVFKTKRWLLDVVVATLIVNLLAVMSSLFAMQVYDRVVPTLAYATLWTLVAGMGIVMILDWSLKTIRARILDSLSCATDKSVTQKVFDHVMQLQLDTRPRSLGTLAAQVGGLDSVRQFFSSGVIFALVDLPFALMFIAFIWVVGGSIAWVYLLALPIAAMLGWVSQKRLRKLLKQQMLRSNERQGLLVDTIQGAESIRTNNATWRFSEEWKSITASISGYNIRQKAISNFATVTTGTLASLTSVAAIVVGVAEIEAGNLTMGALIACSILGGRVIAPVAQSVQYLVQWQTVSQSLSMVDQVLKLDTERRADQSLLMPDEPPKQIGLENIRFSYPNSPIQQLNIAQFNAQAGDRIALLGSIGSGKSTLLKVLAGLYRPSEGRIRLGQADLWEIDPRVVSDHVSYLPQSVHLFKGTLRSNLTLSGVASDSHLLRVCESLGIDRIAADSPNSMDLVISEGGEGLSGGQRQLVGLGRIFLAQPKVWLLDEPTASLDNESERQVMTALRAYVKPEDILIIATHRPALAAQMANRIIVMQQGKIVADGPADKILPKMMVRPQKAVSAGAAAASNTDTAPNPRSSNGSSAQSGEDTV
ncbi:ATP-binding cassette, subfamily C, LapB [Oceanospirillum multiglobuliferum]|uniref:ABC transporter ATP-binding protein n=1 Tax=Oceanospirillum multiglobuliferum TaxID=64969 RepID=A0A1T4RA44_9GAMM|nr:ATP-binding cassette domain-containing protein [Oceanospirillum multiglobuliferum]OPX55147.1 ABC transporter ATP-binding protein [Oceanospirillum multiglobuliferum]SKA12872.1 ATP-binding cassette, subfamily C, LapB [Oceanospirillum multiglobuliferum]